jgi:hypothetical protein
MSDGFTNVGEFRVGKGNRQTRFGPRVRIGTLTHQGTENVNQSPNAIARKKLDTYLRNKGMGINHRDYYIGIMSDAEQLRFMNMPVLGEVFLYIQNLGGIENNYTNIQLINHNAFMPYVDHLLPQREITENGTRAREIPTGDLNIMRLRMDATFARYIRYILKQYEDYIEKKKQMGGREIPIETEFY